jgi:hypothetical protein
MRLVASLCAKESDHNTLDVEDMGIWSGSVRIYCSYQW